LVRGLSNKEIGRALRITEGTVKNHMTSILEKLGVQDRTQAALKAQAAGLQIHIAAARITGLPLVIHAREADADLAVILKREMKKGAFPAVLHCFSSGRPLAETAIALGHYVSFSGILTFKNSQEIRDIARDLPADRILGETDAPFPAPPPHRGKRNEPAYVVNTANMLAEIRGISPGEIARQTSENFFRLFSKVPKR